MITEQEFDEHIKELFHQLAKRIPAGGDPRTILDRQMERVSPARFGETGRGSSHRSRWIATVAAASIVVVGIAALSTRGGSTNQVRPAIASTNVTAPVSSVLPFEATQTTSTAPPIEPVNSVPAQTSLPPLPADPYGDLETTLQSTEDLYYQAMVKAVTKCMSDQGFEYQSVPDPLRFTDGQIADRPWTSPPQDEINARGYLVPGQDVPVVNPDGDTGFGNADYQHALYGDLVGNWELPPGETVPDGFGVSGPIYNGCRPTIQRQIQGDGNPRYALHIIDYGMQLQFIRIQAASAVKASPDYQTAMTAWSDCMRAGGFNYTDPEQPRRQTWSNPRPSPSEVAAATQDATCKDQSRLTEVGTVLFNQLTSDWFTQHPDTFPEMMEFLNGVINRANAVLAS